MPSVFWLLACYCGGSKRSRVRRSAFKGRLFRPTIPPNPSVLVRPNHPDHWMNESNKVWLWGLLKTCSYPLRTYACFLLWPCLLTRMDFILKLETLDLPEMWCPAALLHLKKQHPSTSRTASLVPWFGDRVGPVKLQRNGCELGTRIPTILFAQICAWDSKMAAESQKQREVPKRSEVSSNLS